MKNFIKNFITLSLVLSFCLVGWGNVSLAAEEEQMIRIGVQPSVEKVVLSSDGDFSVKEKGTGTLLFEGSNDHVIVILGSSAEIKTNYRLQVAATNNQTYINDWLNRAEIAGYPTYVEEYSNGYRLMIGEFAADASWSLRNSFRNKMIAEGFAGSDSFWKVITLVSGESNMNVQLGDTALTTTEGISFTSSTFIKINGKTYRGVGEVDFNSSGTLAAINELPLEEYLYGVVPRELPPVPYGELEALKAQAVAARTYTMANLGKRSKDGYDLLPTPYDQVYGGYDDEHPVSTEAVKATEGVVATYGGKYISAVYNSTSGGFSANNEDVWNSDAVPYLRGVPDAERGKAIQHVPTLEVFKNHSNPTSLRAASEGDFESDWSKYHRWTFEWSQEEIQNVLSEYRNTDVGKVLAINVTDRSNSGRVLEIEFVTESGTFYEKKDKVRWALKYINSRGTHSVLLSTLFYIEPITDNKTKEVTGFRTFGGGWGHGVGLSQTGAVGMAEKGYTYEEILKHFYQGIELEIK